MYQELLITFENYFKLAPVLKEKGVGQVPLILRISSDLQREYRVQDVVMQIENIFRELGISPRFPYPCYLLSEEKVLSDNLPIIHQISDFPEHFKVERQHSNVGARSLLQKVQTLHQIIENHSMVEVLEFLKKQKKEQRELKILLNENQFYSEVLEAINK